MVNGKIISVSGPVIKVSGMSGAGLYDVVYAGDHGLLGEIVRLNGDEALVQVYEENTGMRIGEPVVSSMAPLSVQLGPGLLGTIYDGIQRPLEELYSNEGAFLGPGAKCHPLNPERVWDFIPEPNMDKIRAGMTIGRLAETELIEHRVMFPTYLRGGRLAHLAKAGAYTIRDVIATTECGEEIRLAQTWPARRARPFHKKLGVDKPLITGLRSVDVFFPLSKGGTAAIPGGFGTGKTMTQHAVAKWCDADIIVYIGCGERGNEMTDVLHEFPKLIDPRSGKSIMQRTILIANTSNMPVAAREVSIYTGVTLAEYYRDMGYDVAIMADSTSRWAEALRELSGRMEEMPAEEGFPAYLPSRLAEFYERGGRVETLAGSEGSISIIGAVSPPGGDFSEPVTQHTRRFIRCFWALDRELANARHYPAISWLESYSEYAQEVEAWWNKVNPNWARARAKALELLKREQRLQEIVKLIGPDSLPDDQRLILLCADMVKNGFLQQNSFDDIDRFSSPEKSVAIIGMIMDFYERALALVKSGTPLIKIKGMAAVETLSRIKSHIANGDGPGLYAAETAMRSEFDEVERQYAKGMAI